MTEVDWRWIKMIKDDVEYDYTGKYRIYIDGRVESVKRKGVKQNRFLKEGTDKVGYKVVCLSKNSKEKMYLIHRLVACHFITNPHNFTEVDHKNQRKYDNSISNLRWCSSSTNMRNRTMKRKYDLPRGVYLTSSGKYRTTISINGKSKNLGCYDTKEEASDSYEKAYREIEARLEQISLELDNIHL